MDDLAQKPGRRGPASKATRLGSCALVGLGLIAPTASAALSNHADDLPGVRGTVNAVVRTADRIIVGGDFSSIQLRRGPFGEVSPTTGTPIAGPEITGPVSPQVRAAISDGAGGTFIGGQFKYVGGLVRNNLAHILADGTVDAQWDANVSGRVTTMVRLGGTIYFGGDFRGAGALNGNLARDGLAAVDATTGLARAWSPPQQSPVDTPLTLAASGNTIYTRTDAARAFDATTGAYVTSWQPNPEGVVRSIVVSGDTAYLGGSFKKMGGLDRTGLAAVDVTTGALKSWAPTLDASASVADLAVSGSTVYAVGPFLTANGIARNEAAAFDATTGATRSWDAAIHGSPSLSSIAASGSTVYLAGSFAGAGAIGSANRNGFAAVDATTGEVQAWDPQADTSAATTQSAAVSDGRVFVMGSFSQLGPGTPRRNLAAFDAADGHLLPWDPSPDGAVSAMIATESGVVIGGSFHSVGATQRNGLARVDSGTGAADLWNPSVGGGVYAMARSGSTLYVGGGFSSVGGVTRSNAAAVDLPSGGVLPWDPHPDSSVFALAAAGSLVYLGGEFTHLQSPSAQPRQFIAAVDSGSGAPLPAAPVVNDVVDALAINGSGVLLAGSFTAPHRGLALVDAATGSFGPLNLGPSVAAGVAVAVEGQIGTVLSSVGARQFDLGTAATTAWSPGGTYGAGNAQQQLGANASIATDGHGGVVIGSTFKHLDQTASVGFASFSAPPESRGKPAVSGTAVVGQSLTCGEGSWDGSVPQSKAYTWLRAGAVISGASFSAYTLTPADSGQSLGCRVTSSNLGGSASAYSDAVLITTPPAFTGAGEGAAGSGSGVGAGGATRDTVKPKLRGLTLKPSSFRAARAGSSILPAPVTSKKSKTKKKVATSGTAISYQASEPATVVFTVQRATSGLNSAKRCVKATSKLRKAHAKRCTVFTSVVGSFARVLATAGTDTLTFTGRLAGHTLRAASYRLTLTAKDPAGNVSVPVTTAFRVTGKV